MRRELVFGSPPPGMREIRRVAINHRAIDFLPQRGRVKDVLNIHWQDAV
jgi:hypothetical protein